MTLEHMYEVLADTKMILPIEQFALIGHFVKWVVHHEHLKDYTGTVCIIDGKDYPVMMLLSATKMIWDLTMIRGVKATVLTKLHFRGGELLTLWLEVNEFAADLSFFKPPEEEVDND